MPIGTSGNSFIGVDGKPVALHGINWFGFNNGQTCVDGLWNYDALASDFVTTAKRIKSLGFNAIRMPFSFKDLHNLKPRQFVFDTGTLPTDEQISASITPKGESPRKVAKIANEPKRLGTECNGYLPSDSVLSRFIWCVQFLCNAGFYVLIDNHLREDQTALEDKIKWMSLYRNLVQKLCEDKSTRARLIVDILNEPDQFGLRWEDGPRSLAGLYLSAMDTIEEVAPVCYAVEGAGQGSLQCNWGDGFCTDAAEIKDLGLSDPRPFFDKLLQKKYKNRVALAPHVYGPAVTTNEASSSGSTLYARLNSSFGSKVHTGYKGEKFAALIGELGSKLEDKRDISTLTDLSWYLRGKATSAPKGSVPIPNWFWWSWNANSGDTGGLVADDWKTIQWKKLAYLRELGL